MDIKTNLVNAAPYISFGFGVVSIGAAVATAIRATTKLGYILDDYKSAKADIDEVYENEAESDDISEKDALSIKKKEERHLNFATCGRIARLYAPTAAFTALSIGCFTYSVGSLRGKYLAAQTALCGVTEAFDRYREGVRAEFGEDKDLELYHGLKKEKIDVLNPETGKKEKKQALVGDTKAPYSYLWDKYDPVDGTGTTQFERSPELSHARILGTISTFQNSLNAGKEVRMSKLLDELGFEDQRVNGYAEAIAGYKPGDIIKCGLEPEAIMTEDALRFCFGEKDTVTLTFNCRPDIFGITERPEIEDKTIELYEIAAEEGEN